eukprot:645821-Amphidinium_carterae.1
MYLVDTWNEAFHRTFGTERDARRHKEGPMIKQEVPKYISNKADEWRGQHAAEGKLLQLSFAAKR